MIVSQSKAAARPRRPPGRRVRGLLAGVVVLAWTAAAFGLGVVFYDQIQPSLRSLTGTNSVGAAVGAAIKAPARYLRTWFDPEPVESLAIDIKFKHLSKIHAKRDEALQMGLLFTGNEDMVPAEIRHRGETHRVKLRLKGDLPDHLQSDKWSFRVHVRGGDALLGMRRFSIQAPETRGFQAEALFLQTMRDEGVLAPRYDFARVTLNGRDIGLMALEEHFSKELLESQRRREGVILKFDETLFWRNLLLTGSHGPFDNYRTAPLDAFGKGKLLESPESAAQLADGWALLRGFVEGRTSASEAFDEELLGRFLAVCEIWQSVHAVRWHNLRFYFNAIDRELEPIAFDGSLQTHYLGNGLLVEHEPIAMAFLRDPRVREAYVRTVRRLAGELLDGSLQSRLDPFEKRTLRILQREFPMRAPLDYGPLVRRATRLHQMSGSGVPGSDVVHSGQTEYAAPVRATLERDGKQALLLLQNRLPVPVHVQSVRVLPGSDAAPPGGGDGSLPGFPLTLEPTPPGGPPESRYVALPIAAGDDVRVEGTAVVDGQSRPYPFAAGATFPAASGGLLSAPAPEALLATFPFVKRDGPTGLRIDAGTHLVKEALVAPAGFSLLVQAGATLRFAPDAVLVLRGPLHLAGTADRPVLLEPDPSATEQPATWPGLVVLGSAAPSRWTHARVVGTRGFRLGTWTLTGGVTFHESDVEMSDCRLERVTGEDALNVFRSTFELRDVVIRDTRSDAFDSDFSTGKIHGGLFENVGGDAIDFSGSDVTVEGTTFRDIRDKAVSVGEAGKLRADRIVIERAGTGVVSKDRSETRIENSRIREITYVAFMAYVKKPEYGPASLEVADVAVEGAAAHALAQRGSRVVVDGTPVPETDLDVEQLYEEGYMRK